MEISYPEKNLGHLLEVTDIYKRYVFCNGFLNVFSNGFVGF